MKILQEFKTFVMRGNVLDMAVGVIIGAAFGKIVSSLVDNVIMPVIGKLTSGVDFKALYVVIDTEKYKEAFGAASATLAQCAEKKVAVIAYGEFINAIVTFLIVAFSVFVLVKVVSGLQAKAFGEAKAAEAAGAAAPAPAEPPPPTKEQELLAEIRDLLKARQG
ncbi:MAG: large-conductance mechanosensitive channel protein MscL [Puniceicoccales bacterium]|nr:large-conductance mechanosensitive channel protein MscL [Puniceicoccales bacterium]